MKKKYVSPLLETTVLGFSLMQDDVQSGKGLYNGDGGGGAWPAPRKPF